MCLKHQAHAIVVSTVAILAAFAMPAAAQDDQTLKQSTPAQFTAWEPIIAHFYMISASTTPPLVDGALVPDFSADTLIGPKPRLEVFAPPAEIPDPPPLYVDWQQFVASREPASAWLVTRNIRGYEGIPRIGVHRVGSNYSDEADGPLPFVGYADGGTVKLHLRIDVPFEKLPFTPPAGTDRKKYILENIKVVGKKLVFEQYNDVRRGGEGGSMAREEYNPEKQLESLTTLADFVDPSKPYTVTYQPREQTNRNPDGTYSRVLVISCRFDLEAGPELGLNPPERKTLEGQIRVAVLDESKVRFMTLEESRRNVTKPARPSPKP